MSFLADFVSNSVRDYHAQRSLHQTISEMPSDHEDNDDFDDDDSALVEEHAPLASDPTSSNKYGGVDNNNNNSSKDKQKGLGGAYVDWTHSHESILQAWGAFLGYIVVAIVGYSFVFEEWSILDSMYFAVTVFTTVGYGDLAPSSDVSRLFTIAFASSGIVILGVFLGIIGTRLFELRQERVNVKLQGVQKRVLHQFGTEPKFSSQTGESEEISLVDERNKEATTDRKPGPTFAQAVWRIIKIEFPLVLGLILLSSPVVYLEGWDPVMGLYWMFVTGTTIGFGDLRPTHTLTKAICIVYLPLAAAVFGEMLGQIAGAYIEYYNDKVEDEFLDRALERGDLEKMDLDDDDIVEPYEFLSYMLVTLGKAETEDINEILEVFRKLDKNNDGYLSKKTLNDRYNLKVKPSLRRKHAYRQLTSQRSGATSV